MRMHMSSVPIAMLVHSYVYKQPESPEEEALCQEAMDGCPVEAIGSDGA